MHPRYSQYLSWHLAELDELGLVHVPQEVPAGVDVAALVRVDRIVGHGDGGGVVLPQRRRTSLAVVETTEDGAEVEDLHAANTGSHELRLGGAQSDAVLALRLPGDGSIV